MAFSEEQLKDAARKAYAAGDTAAAKRLIDAAKAAAGSPAPAADVAAPAPGQAPAATAPVARSPADASPISTAPVVIASTPPRIDETASAPAPSERPPLREQFSREYFETAGRAAGGLAGGEGVTDLSGSVPVYREGGAEASIPAPVLPVAEYLGDVLMTAASAGGGAYGYLAGGLGDLLVNAGVMDRPSAQVLVRDLMAMPEAFAGSPGQVISAPRTAATRAVRGAPEAAPPAAAQPLALPPPAAAPGAPSAVRPTGAPPASMPPATATGAAPGAGPAAAPSGGPSARPAAAAVDEDARIGELIRKGAAFGVGGRRARDELARLAVANPKAKAAADRLGIELPVDVLSDVRQIREAIGMTRSIGGSEAKRTWSDNLIDITERADKAITDLAGATDLSTVSSSVLSSLDKTRTQLRGEAKKIYDDVEAVVPPGTVFQPNNIVTALNKIIGDLGGVEGMTDAERKLFKLVTNPDQPITYMRLMREKDQIRRAKDGDIRDNPYGSIDQRSLRTMYDALVADQLANAERIGGADLRKNLELANSLYKQQSELGDKIVLGFGKDMNGSISQKLRNAITTGKKGDISGLNSILEIVPKDLRKEAVLSAIREVSSSTQGGERGFGFSQFTDFYSSMRRNPVVYKEIVKNIGPEAETVLRDLYEVSRRVTDARANVISTGKANQPLLGAMVAEGLVGKVFSSTAGRRAVRAAGSGGGALVGGIPGAMLGDAITDAITSGSPDRLKDAGKLFASDAFKDLVEKAAANTVTEKSKSRLLADPMFRKWAKASDIGDPRVWLQGALLGLTADEGEMPQAGPQ